MTYGRSDTPLRIRIDARRHADHVVLTVADKGPGIAPEHQPKVLDMFYRAHSEGDGTGLGLSIVARIAQAHRGSVHVESTPGQGATFILKLPYSPPAS